MKNTKIGYYLDKAATQLDQKGYNDLADKVDRYNARLEKANERERKVIARALDRIEREAERRDDKKSGTKTQGNETHARRRRAAIRARARRRAADHRHTRVSKPERKPEPRRAKNVDQMIFMVDGKKYTVALQAEGEQVDRRAEIRRRVARRAAIRRVRKRMANRRTNR